MNKKVSARKRDTFLLPKFALQIHHIITSKYKDTYVVGGAIRNLFLKKKITDVDIATIATPKQVIALLQKEGMEYNDEHQRFGVVLALSKGKSVEITTFRSEAYTKGRFPKITYAKSPKIDSNRRDFTINALYYNPFTKEVLDFHEGLKDLQNKVIKFIGDPLKRIQEDPLRIVRAYRFKLQYNLNFESKTEKVLRDNKKLLKNISATRLQREINFVKTKSLQKTLEKVIHNST